MRAVLLLLDKPIGALLLLWPTLWALWLASLGWPRLDFLAIFVVGTFVMRSAGCALNDLADRNFDLHVERTRKRPLAAREIQPLEALAVASVLLLSAFALVLYLNRMAVLLSFAGLAIAASYPFAKRFFPLPQLYLGIAFGFAMANSVRWKQALQPWISGFYATPTIALAPLFILWLGIGIWSKVLVVIFLVLFPVTINTEAGLRTTSERLIEMLRSFGASPRQIFFKVSLPSAVPFILAGLKLGIGRGLIGVVVAELFGSRAGLGRLIAQSADAFNMPELFAGVIVLAVAGIAIPLTVARVVGPSRLLLDGALIGGALIAVGLLTQL